MASNLMTTQDIAEHVLSLDHPAQPAFSCSVVSPQQDPDDDVPLMPPQHGMMCALGVKGRAITWCGKTMRVPPFASCA